ncbi:C-5 cytosine-specific DNA methylase [Nostoc commune NIES-4072]|uniref:C-5 cytosine-specific DNA methylase n=1 Tax=Nostoc commune NIES-4072 TaxID=2005467 RepID=A0A2R5FW85_NOSCO|nr:C-5 cytosine-specific DNA methylase [Nostoc commune HK-02]GBG22980.1 C-5 cytosine-specific DNA methylase [Nostoc commune NIES-4072]
MTKSVIVELYAIPEKFLENDLKASQFHSQGCLYPYLIKDNQWGLVPTT